MATPLADNTVEKMVRFFGNLEQAEEFAGRIKEARTDSEIGFSCVIPNAAVLAVGDVLAEQVLFVAPFAMTIDSLKLTDRDGVALHADDYLTFIVRKGVAGSTIISRNTKTGDANVIAGGLVANTPFTPATLANATLAAGDVVTLEITKGGLGKAAVTTLQLNYHKVS